MALLMVSLMAWPTASTDTQSARKKADARAFLASRREAGVSNRSLLRGLAGLRSFLRFLDREGHAKIDAFAAARICAGLLFAGSLTHLSVVLEVARRAALGALRQGAVAGMEAR